MTVNRDQPPYVTGPLADYWNRRVANLTHLPEADFSPEETERHRLYALLVMALVSHYWNGNKRGSDGDYPWREQQKLADGTYDGGDYLGHNIAALAVDGAGRVIDFDFNHNVIFGSSVEHAESRLIRRVFSLVQLRDDWRPSFEARLLTGAPRERYVTSLRDVTVYTTLEPCAQCAGIMALGLVRAVVYLQRDPGMYLIGNILRNLTPLEARAPLPIPASALDLEHFRTLDEGYRAFCEGVATKPFHVRETIIDRSPSITSFLCTDDALRVFRQAEVDLQSYKLRFPDFVPPDASPPDEDSEVLSTRKVLQHLLKFFTYAISKGQRATPHQA